MFNKTGSGNVFNNGKMQIKFYLVNFAYNFWEQKMENLTFH